MAAPATNLYDAIVQTRPIWISRPVGNARGNDAIAVYMGTQYQGPLSVLRQFSVNIAESVRYLSPTEAKILFGPDHGTRAAIVVTYARP